jgi:hypothetical protein
MENLKLKQIIFERNLKIILLVSVRKLKTPIVLYEAKTTMLRQVKRAIQLYSNV